MLRFHLIGGLIVTAAMLAVTPTTTAHASDTQGALTKASDWLGHVVVTRDGKELGTVRDFAIDDATGKVVYVVVSVGSFLIENNLIAVAPDALVRSRGEDGVLQLQADPNSLHDVKRFASDGHWPAAAGVVRADGSEAAPPAEAAAAAPAAAAPPTGTATIESRSKTAHLSASERVITDTTPPPVPAPVSKSASTAKTSTTAAATSSRPPPITEFERLDKDGDGVLNRSEFAPVIAPKDSYSKIDTNADGVIEPEEFDAYEQARGGGTH